MKKITTLLVLLLFSSELLHAQCERAAPFQNGPEYPLTGTATFTFLSNGSKTLRFDSSFSTTSGPDLHVYLSQSATVSTPGGVLQTPNTIDLGLLKSASGSQSYDVTGITPAVDIVSYTYIIIHCKEYDHYWGTGTFGAPSGVDCENLDVGANDENGVEMYPSLIQDHQFFVRIGENKTARVTIFSILGESMQETLILSEELSSINTSFLKKGMYIVRLDIDGKIRTQKMIIP